MTTTFSSWTSLLRPSSQTAVLLSWWRYSDFMQIISLHLLTFSDNVTTFTNRTSKLLVRFLCSAVFFLFWFFIVNFLFWLRVVDQFSFSARSRNSPPAMTSQPSNICGRRFKSLQLQHALLSSFLILAHLRANPAILRKCYLNAPLATYWQHRSNTFIDNRQQQPEPRVTKSPTESVA